MRPAHSDAPTCTSSVCLGEDREHIDPLEVAQWKFYVLPKSKLDRNMPKQKTIGLGPLIALGAHPCTYDELKAAIHEAASVSRGA